jgi:hypothetical protein
MSSHRGSDSLLRERLRAAVGAGRALFETFGAIPDEHLAEVEALMSILTGQAPRTPLPAKRLREALLKNRITHVPSVASVVIRMSPTETRVFKKPDVYNADGTYLIFGVPLEDAEETPG